MGFKVCTGDPASQLGKQPSLVLCVGKLPQDGEPGAQAGGGLGEFAGFCVRLKIEVAGRGVVDETVDRPGSRGGVSGRTVRGEIGGKLKRHVLLWWVMPERRFAEFGRHSGFREQQPQGREDSTGVAAMHGHSQPVTSFFTAHLVDAVGDLGDAIDAAHGGEGAEEESE